MSRPRCLVCGVAAVLGVFAAAPPAPAQVKYPPLPETVDVQLRYRIRADREERVRQYRALEAHLKAVGFVRKRQAEDDLDVFDPTAERFEGTVPSKNVAALLDDPRVKTVLFRPTDFKAPDDPLQPVPLRLRLATGYLPADQQRLHRQVAALLARLGFREAVAYDTAGFTLLRGDLPYVNLFRLLKDLRTEPAGWFATDTPADDLPLPLRDVIPVRVVEVLANADLTFLAPPPVPPTRVVFTPAVRAVLDDPAAAARPLRVEVVTDHALDVAELDLLRSRLRAAYGRPVVDPATQQREVQFTSLEGAIGNVLTLQFPQAAGIEAFAGEPGVVFIRLPRPAVETAAPLAKDAAVTAPADALAATRLAAFHALGYRGQGTKVVVVAPDFPGLKQWMGVRYFDTPAAPVAYVDLTAELSRDLTPAPVGRSSGAGTAAARAVRLAAPGAAVVLVRVDPASFHQVYGVARSARGEGGYSEAMQSRITELTARTEDVRRRNALAAAEYRSALEDTGDNERQTERRERAVRAFDLLVREESAIAGAIARATALQNDLRALAGSTVVVNTLVWEAGYALDGLNELARYLNAAYASDAVTGVRTRSATRPRAAPRPLWVQAASPSAGSVWGGPVLDHTGDGLTEFAPPEVPLPPGEWTRKLNFLAARSADGATSPTLAAGAKFRLTVQWRETHDPTAYGGRDAIFPLALRVFKQLDPDGAARASDELREVARSAGAPYRLVAAPTYGVYEQVVEFAAPEDGRYCVAVEGLAVFDPRLPALRQVIEVTPRLFAESLTPEPGVRPVFASYAPRTSGVGMPGDAKAAVTVGVTSGPLGTTTTGLVGGGPGVTLLTKPDLLADGTVGAAGGGPGGSAVAAGFAGGTLAALVGSGAPTAEIVRAVGLQPGGPVQVPENWLRVVPRRLPPP